MADIVRSFVTIKQMLGDRGMDTSNLDAISEDELITMANVNKIFVLKVTDSYKIVYYLNTKFKINDLVKKFEPNDTVLLVFKEKINNLNIRNLKDVDEVTIEIFMLKELQYNISHHHLVPKHEIMSDDEEVERMLSMYQLKRNQLPIIQKSDPMARYLDVKSGQVLKITRNSPSAGEAVVYRYCV